MPWSSIPIATATVRGPRSELPKCTCARCLPAALRPRPRSQNDSGLDEVYSLGPIAVRSACAHHFVPVTGRMWVGVLPADKLIGISNFVRLANWILSRPHLQEEATVMLADELEGHSNRGDWPSSSGYSIGLARCSRSRNYHDDQHHARSLPRQQGNA